MTHLIAANIFVTNDRVPLIILRVSFAVHQAVFRSVAMLLPRSGEIRTQKLKSHLVKTQSLNVLPLKPGVGQFIAIHNTLTARDFSSLLISTLPVHSPAFFPKPLSIFPVLAVANTWFLCRPTE